MNNVYHQADYMKESRFWMNVQPLTFKQVHSGSWTATDSRGRNFRLPKYGKSSPLHLSISFPTADGHERMSEAFVGNNAMTALANGSDHSNNGFRYMKYAAYFASCLAATASNQKLVAAIYLAPHFIDFKAQERGIYHGKTATPYSDCGGKPTLNLVKMPDGWRIELPEYGLPDGMSQNADGLPEPEAIFDLRFNTKKQASIAAGLYVRDCVNHSSFHVRKEHLGPFVGRDLISVAVDKDSLNKFKEILSAVSHTGWCRDTFEAAVYVEASKATRGYPQPEDCLSAALMLLRAYSEAK